MFKLAGIVAVVFGFLVARSARRGDGISSAAGFVLGLAFIGAGLYLIFVEDGRGAARWLPFLGP